MGAMRRYWADICVRTNREEYILMGIAVALFLPVYVAGAALAAVLIYLAVQRRLIPLLRSAPHGPFLAAFAALSIVVPLCYRNWLGLLADVGFVLILLIGLYARSVMTPQAFKGVLDIGCLMSYPACAVALVQYALWGDVPFYRTPSLFENANYYAMIVEFVLAFCLYRLLQPQSGRRRVFYGLTILVNLAGLYICDCRTAFGVLAVMAPVMLLLARRWRAFWCLVGAGLAFVAAVVWLAPGLIPRADAILPDLGIRMGHWQNALRGIADHPLLGQGGMTYRLVLQRYGGFPVVHAHSVYLDPVLNYGVLGAALLVGYLSSYLTGILRLFRQGHRLEGMLAAGVVTAILVHGLLDVTIFWVQTGALAALVLGVVGRSPAVRVKS